MHFIRDEDNRDNGQTQWQLLLGFVNRGQLRL